MRSDLGWLLGGFVEVEISGGNTEKFLNCVLRAGAQPRNVRRLEGGVLTMRVALAEIRPLRLAARDSHCRIHIKKRRGLPFLWAFLRRRPVILAMLPLAIALMVFAASLIFSVQVTSPYELSEEDIWKVEQLAEQAGLRAGASRWRIDLEQVEQAILAGFPDVYYAEIFEHGVHVDISVVKRVNVPEEERMLPPGAVLATADGVIVDILVRRGTAMVSSGDTVKKGDVLIHGRLGDQLLTADGIVTATVYGEGYGEWALEQTALRITGQDKDSLGLRLPGGKTLHLLGAAESPYELFQLRGASEPLLLWRIIPLPVEVVYEEYCQLEQYSLLFDAEEARQLARTVAGVNAKAAVEMLVNAANIREIHTVVEDIELADGLKRARALSTALAEIGGYQAYEQEITAEDIPLPEPEAY